MTMGLSSARAALNASKDTPSASTAARDHVANPSLVEPSLVEPSLAEPSLAEPSPVSTMSTPIDCNVLSAHFRITYSTRALGGLRYHLEGVVELRLGLGHVVPDAGQRLHHRRLLVVRKADQLAAVAGPRFAGVVVESRRRRAERGRGGRGVAID